MNDINIKVGSIEFFVNDDAGHTIRVLVDESGSLTIHTHDAHDRFLFCRSKPDLVAAVGRLLIKASELCKYRLVSIDDKT